MAALAHTPLSVIIPLYNEEDNVAPLLEAVHRGLAPYPGPWELILVDDGSTDGTGQRLMEGARRYGDHVRVLTLRRNFGQTAAMQAGIDCARGAVIAMLDGDLQNDPKDIPPMVERLLEEDLDLVAGWRKERRDSLMRTLPSRIANRLIARITGVRLHDYGCSLKVFRAEVIKGVRLYGEMHRFIPAWVAAYTSPLRIREQVVTHHPRRFGRSKYGLSRVFPVLLDLLSVYFYLKFRARPGHFFGKIGLTFAALGGGILGYLFFIKAFLGQDIGTRPLLLAGVLLAVVGVQFLTTGVLSEILARIYFESTPTRSYALRQSVPKEAGWRLNRADSGHFPQS